MIEIRIPKEIKNYREKLFFGLTLRQSICTAIALLICVPIYIFGNRFLPQEAISWIVILIAVPLMFTGFFRYNDMAFEQFVLEVVRFYTSPQQRVYSYEPPFMEFRNGYIGEKLTAEIEMMKSRKKRFFKRK